MAEKDIKSKKVFLTILFIFIFVGIGSFLGFNYYMNKNNTAESKVIKEGFVEIGEIFVNLSDEGSRRYVKLNMSVSYDESNEKLFSELENKKVIIRDVANFYIKSCVAKDFESENEDVLKADLIARINQKLTNGLLKDLYISEIIVQ